MNKKQELRKIAHLETQLDHVESELNHLNNLLLECGFPEGVKTLKSTIEELLQEAENQMENPKSPPDENPFALG